jgi:membrane protease subunit HflC
MSRRILIVSAIVIVVVGIVALSSLFTVHQTQQVLVLQFGDPKT